MLTIYLYIGEVQSSYYSIIPRNGIIFHVSQVEYLTMKTLATGLVRGVCYRDGSTYIGEDLYFIAKSMSMYLLTN